MVRSKHPKKPTGQTAPRTALAADLARVVGGTRTGTSTPDLSTVEYVIL